MMRLLTPMSERERHLFERRRHATIFTRCRFTDDAPMPRLPMSAPSDALSAKERRCRAEPRCAATPMSADAPLMTLRRRRDTPLPSDELSY